MPKKRRKTRRSKTLKDLQFDRPKLELEDQTKRWIVIVSLLTLGTLSFLSLLGSAGTFGVYLSGILGALLGATRWFAPVILVGLGYIMLRPAKYNLSFTSYFGLTLLLLGLTGLLHIILHSEGLWEAAKAGQGGGYIGLVLSAPAFKLMGFGAGVVLIIAVAIIGGLLLFNHLFSRPDREDEDENEDEQDEDDEELTQEKVGLFLRLRNAMSTRSIRKLQARKQRHEEQINSQDEPDTDVGFSERTVEVVQQGGNRDDQATEDEGEEGEPDEEAEEAKEDEQDDENENELEPASKSTASAQKSHKVRKFKSVKIDMPFNLLSGKVGSPSGGDIKANILIIKKTLAQFGIKAEMGEAVVGPTVTQYPLKPSEGVRLSKIIGLSDNLALALAAHPIRIEAPIPGRSMVGIEVPNQATAIVPLRQVLDSEEFHKRPSNMMIALGSDVMGKPWFTDLSKLPHILIAGATGSGKSVCINVMIQTLLFQNGPGELKFIMVDPKRVELPVYNGIPHLLTPVITNVKKTINSLRWAIVEMERRFELLAGEGKRNIQSYNQSAKQPLPYIVIVIDELADLMAAAAGEVEAAIIRLAQMSRAVGIHLVLATQRPSVDVITGLIKANIPARIAFSVASLVDSRTILDTSGAEKLLGRGDMLYLSADLGKPRRLQGAFASDDDIKNVIDHLKKQAEPEYIEEVVEKQGSNGIGGLTQYGDDGEGDPLLAEAMDVVYRAKKASASLLQRRLRVGYARAARLLDLLEQRGLIGPGVGAKPREVFMDKIAAAASSLEEETEEDEVEDEQAEDEEEVDEQAEEDEEEGEEDEDEEGDDDDEVEDDDEDEGEDEEEDEEEEDESAKGGSASGGK